MRFPPPPYFSSPDINVREIIAISQAALSLSVDKNFNLTFYASDLKGPPGASSNWIVRPSVCLSVRNSVPLQ